MDLKLKDQLFIVGGASAGFGNAIALALINEGAHVIAVARGEEKLKALKSVAPAQVTVVTGDITQSPLIEELVQAVGDKQLHGIVVNAGGPPAKTFMETTLEDWDEAYRNILRWKIHLTQTFIPRMIPYHYGRMVYIESSSVKQPLDNLVLSNSLRVAVAGMVKTFSQEIAASGITLNVLGPGSHNTAAIDRVYRKKSEQTGIPFNEVKQKAVQAIPVGQLGEASDFANLALWLLSSSSRYVTGQTITVDGGSVKGIF